MGLLKPGEKRYVATTKMMEIIETTELTRSVMMRARIWSIVRTESSDTLVPAGSGGAAMSHCQSIHASASQVSRNRRQDGIEFDRHDNLQI